MKIFYSQGYEDGKKHCQAEIAWLREQCDRRYQEGLQAGYRQSRNMAPKDDEGYGALRDYCAMEADEMNRRRMTEEENDDAGETGPEDEHRAVNVFF